MSEYNLIKYKDTSFFSCSKLNKTIKLIRKDLSQPNLFNVNIKSTQSGFFTNNQKKEYSFFGQHNFDTSNSNSNTTNITNTLCYMDRRYKAKSTSSLVSVDSQKKIKDLRTEQIYQKIFPKVYHERSKNIDNKFNIVYSENHEQFEKNLMKMRLNNKSILGQFEHGKSINENESQERIIKIKSKIGFIKGVADYSYPTIVLHKIKEKQKILSLHSMKKKIKFKNPCDSVYDQYKKYQKKKTKSLTESITIINDSCLNPKKMFQ